IEELRLLGKEYESIRREMESGPRRTEQMSLLVERVQVLGGQQDAGQVGEEFFAQNTDGSRIVGFALARCEPQRRHVDMAIKGIVKTRSPFEQYHALLLTKSLVTSLDPSALERIRLAIQSQINSTIRSDDPSRWSIANQLLADLGRLPSTDRW